MAEPQREGPASDDPDTVTASERTARLLRAATYASVVTAAGLVVLKLGAWWLTHSVSLLSTLVDSLLDVAASVINLLAIRAALTPADHDHRFGHGKAEPLAALGQSAFIGGSAVFLLLEVSQRFLDPRPIEATTVGIAVMVFSIAATLALLQFQKYVIRETGSLVIEADALHFSVDVLVNASVIVALLLVAQFGWLLADPLFGLGIGVYILWNAWKLMRSSLDMLMDRELADDERTKISRIILANEEVCGLHDLRTRSSGRQIFVQCHVELDGDMSLAAAHAVTDRIEVQLEEAYPQAEILFHQDPHGIEERHGVPENLDMDQPGDAFSKPQ
ncbi:cation diffusion facilitator family transporter [Pelagibius sp. Alg239-R121]|uniref:cation diffusion facilitator family transporter n=1 Tax=Pelagibius sp. Alg239-R121 TaxID=2993448 RepID=UPI0024A6183E|nr:cation diffusion facilitator family transporter [Pelagibius sp. Alg239-R121]